MDLVLDLFSVWRVRGPENTVCTCVNEWTCDEPATVLINKTITKILVIWTILHINAPSLLYVCVRVCVYVPFRFNSIITTELKFK